MLSGLSVLQAVQSGYIPEPRLSRISLLNGQTVWQATCSLPVSVFAPGGLYANLAVGSSTCKVLAVYKAVSEALERLAYVAVRQSKQKSAFGFAQCHDTTGMAAAPRLSMRARAQARSRAEEEATERWAIEQWWRGCLPAKRLPSRGAVQALCIEPTPSRRSSGTNIVIAWSNTTSGRAFGFGAGSLLGHAFESAIIELSRNQRALAQFGSNDTACLTLQERRVLYFAGKDGRREFDERAESSFTHAPSAQLVDRPKLVVDEPVTGPWSRYGVVWRCLYEGTEWMSSSETNAFAF